MERLPDISMKNPEEVKELADDLRVINGDTPLKEDLSQDPFDRSNVTNRKVEPLKPKKRVATEKQKNSLAKAREVARQKRAEKKKAELEKIKERENPQPQTPQTPQVQLTVKNEEVVAQKMETLKERNEKIIEKKEEKLNDFVEETGFDENEDYEDMDEVEFNMWLKNFDKFKKMMDAVEKEKERQRIKEEQKELQLREKYFKMFKEQNPQTQVKQTPPPKQQYEPKYEPQILDAEPTDYGEFSNYF